MNTVAIKNLADAIDYIKKHCQEWRVKAKAETFTRLETHENDNGFQVVKPVEYIRIWMYQDESDELKWEAPVCPEMLIAEDRQWAIVDYAKAMVRFLNSNTPPTPEEWEKEPVFVPEDMAF